MADQRIPERRAASGLFGFKPVETAAAREAQFLALFRKAAPDLQAAVLAVLVAAVKPKAAR